MKESSSLNLVLSFLQRALVFDEWSDQTRQMIGELILWNTLFEDKKILKEEITKSMVMYSPSLNKLRNSVAIGLWDGMSSKNYLQALRLKLILKMSVTDLLKVTLMENMFAAHYSHGDSS